MINAQMRFYDYFTYEEKDDYGQPQLAAEPSGVVIMAINTTSQSIQDNINYEDANYIGLTQARVDNTYVIKYEDKMLKVLYVIPNGRFKQVFMKEI